MKNLYNQIAVDQVASNALVLATITGSEGSTPQKAGSSAIFGMAGLLAGTVGGGVLEAEVQHLAENALHTKQSGYHHFNLQHDINDTQRAICGGRVRILIDAAPTDHMAVFEKVKQSLLQRDRGVLVTHVTGINENQTRVHRFWFTAGNTTAIPEKFPQQLKKNIMTLLTLGKPGDFMELPVPGSANGLFLVEALFPLPHLIIAGAGHIGKALAHLGKLLDFSVTVVDERAGYANSDVVPDADQVIVKDYGTALGSIGKSKDTYIVIVTPGHKNDAEALKPCIGSGAAYIGMIGSLNKIALMRNKFITEGWSTAEQWDTVHAPVGIDIGSKSVQEIALSIAAELVMVRNKKN